MSEANRVRIAIRPTGSSPWTTLRRTGDALTASAQTVRSDSIRSDRMRDGQKVTTITVGGTIDFEMTAAEYDQILAAAMCNDWATDVLTVGTDTVTFDVLKSYLDSGDHVLMSAMEVSQLQLTMNAGEKITAQVTFAGTEADPEYDPSSDTFNDPSDALLFDSSNNLSSILIDGDALSGTCVTGMSLTINNNHSQDQCLGSLYQRQHKGSCDITGTKTIRMAASAFDLWKNTLTSTPVSSSFTMGDGSNSYVFDIGTEFLSGDLPSGGLDAILSMELNSTVATDSAGEMLTITRSLAP